MEPQMKNNPVFAVFTQQDKAPKTQKQKSLPEASFHLVSPSLCLTACFSFQLFLLVFECFFWASLNQCINFLAAENNLM